MGATHHCIYRPRRQRCSITPTYRLRATLGPDARRTAPNASIPLVLCSSKTAAELLVRCAEDLVFRPTARAIVENGAGVLLAGEARAQPEPSHKKLLDLLDALPRELRSSFAGFSGWSSEILQANTGLDAQSAARAARRDYSEPGLWQGDAESLQRFIEELDELGVRVQRGGRFLTLGFAASKPIACSKWRPGTARC